MHGRIEEQWLRVLNAVWPIMIIIIACTYRLKHASTHYTYTGTCQGDGGGEAGKNINTIALALMSARPSISAITTARWPASEAKWIGAFPPCPLDTSEKVKALAELGKKDVLLPISAFTLFTRQPEVRKNV